MVDNPREFTLRSDTGKLPSCAPFLFPFGLAIRLVRRVNGLSLESVAVQARLNPTDLTAIENGTSTADPACLDRLCQALEISLVTLTRIAELIAKVVPNPNSAK